MSSPPDGGRRLTRLFDAWNRRLPSAGQLALAALVVGIVTGVALSAGYDVGAAQRSLGLVELSSRWGRLLRSLHAWSGHALLLLALAHTAEHLALRSEARLPPWRWIRVVLLVPVLVGLLLSGFILKGDAEAEMARHVVAGLLDRLPWGPAAAAALTGTGRDLQLPYVHHAATLTVLVAWLAVEHGRRVWPSNAALLYALAGIAAGALLNAPALHDGVDPVVKGPWFLVAVQELLHWTSRPGWLWGLAALPLAALALLPRLGPRPRGAAVRLLAAGLITYALVGLFAQLFRGPGWALRPPWAERPASRAAGALLHPLTWERHDESKVALLRGRVEGCLSCHDGVTGIEPAHAAQVAGCSGCHLGDPQAPGAEAAHRGLVRVPGNLDTAALTCGRPGCHDGAVERVQGSMMANVPGMIAVDRWALGEQRSPDGTARVAELGSSPADTHLRQMCVGCHLGRIKEHPAPTREQSRGGGCVACHLRELERRDYAPWRSRGFAHPRLSVQVEDGGCFGCHARSARISLAYAGWTEAGPGAGAGAGVTAGARLRDGRVAWRAPADVHHERGLACVDCHTARETMGDGQRHAHEEQATRVRCTTCHRVTPARSVAWTALDGPVQATVRSRLGEPAPGRYLMEDRTGEPLTNAWPLPGGRVELRGKLSDRRHLATPPAAACTEIEGHRGLSCQACHAAWVTTCSSCHTQWDGRAERIDPLTRRREPGAWVEYDGQPAAGPPALGVFTRDGATRVEPVVPGMIMTLNGPAVAAPSPLPDTAGPLLSKETRFVRAYALAVPHTTTRAGRSCASCHREPSALGYGRGALALARVDGRWTWRFEPEHAASPFDGLPADAWIPFLSDRPATATRTALRPLDREAQLRTLAVGACLPCHDPALPRWRGLYLRFRESLGRATPRCEVPPSPPIRP